MGVLGRIMGFEVRGVTDYIFGCIYENCGDSAYLFYICLPFKGTMCSF